MALRLVLADKSAHEQRHHPEVEAEIERLAVEDRLAVCELVALELLYSARNPRDYAERDSRLRDLRWLSVTHEVMRRTLEVQALLARRGQHRRPIPDLIVAATAEVHGAEVLHYDHDFDLIAEVTGQPVRWIIPRGTGH